MTGGEGSLTGTMLGVLILTMVSSGLQLANVLSYGSLQFREPFFVSDRCKLLWPDERFETRIACLGTSYNCGTTAKMKI